MQKIGWKGSGSVFKGQISFTRGLWVSKQKENERKSQTTTVRFFLIFELLE
jgi:hypothetical protein